MTPLRLRHAATPIRVGISALLLGLGLGPLGNAAPSSASPRKSTAKTKHADSERLILACVDERTGPDGGITTDEAFTLCRGIARHQAKITKLAKRVSDAKTNGATSRLVKRLELECAEEVSIACEDTTERSEDHGECSDATLRAKHAYSDDFIRRSELSEADRAEYRKAWYAAFGKTSRAFRVR